jgi:hypothetical protein
MDVRLPAFGGSRPPLQPTRSGAAAWSRRCCQRCVALCKNIRHTLHGVSVAGIVASSSGYTAVKAICYTGSRYSYILPGMSVRVRPVGGNVILVTTYRLNIPDDVATTGVPYSTYSLFRAIYRTTSISFCHQKNYQNLIH